MNTEEKYQAELKQSDLDHHKPTAGAMTGHIISNLLIHSLKINQASLFAKGTASLFLAEKSSAWIAYEQQEFAQLNRLLVNNGENIPNTTDQFDEDGHENVLQVLHSGDYVGENWLFGQDNTNNYVETTVQSEICLLKRQDFLELMHDQPRLSIKLLELNMVKTANLQKQIQLLTLPKVEDRVLRYLQTYADKIGKSSYNLPLKMKDLALYLGTTPETLSRELSLLEEQGKLKRKLRKVELVN